MAIITGGSYFVATCTQCETMMIFGNALSPDANEVPRRTGVFLACPTCLQKENDHPDDIWIAKSRHLEDPGAKFLAPFSSHIGRKANADRAMAALAIGGKESLPRSTASPGSAERPLAGGAEAPVLAASECDDDEGHGVCSWRAAC